MLRVSRPSEIPQFLRSPHVIEERRKILDYLRRSAAERRQRRDNLNEDLFFDRALRSALSYVFHNKCAFCETQLNDNGHVLHMRPLRRVEESAYQHPDYYLWLAFEWRNLFYACDFCIKCKGDKFPIENEPADFLATFTDVLKHERSLLIDPTAEDPGKHLFFSTEGDVYPLTPKGAETIDVFMLNRKELTADRSHEIYQMFFLLTRESTSDIHHILSFGSPHAGTLISILQRVLVAWRPNGLYSLGTGKAFVSRFIEIWDRCSSEERNRLNVAIEDVKSGVLDSPRPAIFDRTVYMGMIRTREWSVEAGDIARVRISNFKAIEQLDFNLPIRRSDKAGTPALMILGENSSGKSSVLAAIALAAIGSREARKLKKHLPALVHSSSTNRFDQLDHSEVNVEINFHLHEHQAAFQYDPELGKPTGPDEPAVKVLGYGPRRFFDPKRRQHKDGAAARVQTLFDPLATIPYPGDWLRTQTGARFDAVAAALRVILALSDDDELIVEPDHLAVRANGRVTPIDALSEGYRSVFVMTVDIIRELLDDSANLEKAQALVLIDELETHLHPRWKMQVMTSLRKVFPRVQFIVTTHDPLCLRGMDDGEVMVLQRDQNGLIHALEGLPSVKGMTAEQLLTSDYFGLASTTDPSTEIRLASIAGDVARKSAQGDLSFLPATATSELVGHLLIGDSPSEQIVQEALATYLERREVERGSLRPQLRADAVKAIIDALTRDEG
ncbi:AAA family ATPase [Pseudomonas chlororaphis]|uniref:AAA family ATPase n=1 Tax=Pseudomonas chlororaphis TaxID=587753 RepID=UPI00167B63B9|nr:AAA family ATPase [Pseudomonas chlororaphis]